MKKYLVACLLLFGYLVTTAKENPTAQKWLGQRALTFTENKGQVTDSRGALRPDILFTATNNGVGLFFQRNVVSYVYPKVEQVGGEATVTGVYRSDVEFIGANPNVEILAQEQAPGVSNFYLGANDITNVRSFSKVVYKNLYANIDLVYYAAGNGAQMKYDFIVHPGGNVADIQMRYIATSKLQVTREGSLLAQNNYGRSIEDAPYTYQTLNGVEKAVTTSYQAKNGVVTFDVKGYDNKENLVIDPLTRVWSLSAGGSTLDRGESVVVDVLGNVTVAGRTSSTNFPATPGAMQINNGGRFDAVVAQFNASTGAVNWTTYYGGSMDDQAQGITADAAGALTVVGYTSSTNLPVSAGAFQAASNGQGDGFILQLSNSGVRNWATYYGGTSNDQLLGVDVLNNNSVVVVGRTFSAGMATTGAAQTALAGNRDAVISVFSSTGARQWSTYFGGSGDDQGTAVTADDNDNIIAVGLTGSNGLATAGAAQATNNGSNDAFVVKYNVNGARQWSTYYGGTGTDFANAVSYDASGNVFVVGQTSSTNFSTSPGAFQATNNGLTDGFVLGLSPAGARMMASYLGGAGTDQANGVDVIGSNVYVVGATNSPASTGGATDFRIINPGAANLPFQSANAGAFDLFVVKINATNATRTWAIVYGGNADEVGRGVFSTGAGNLAIVGYTNSNNYPVTVGTNTADRGNDQVLALQLSDDVSGCAGISVTATSINPACGVAGSITVTGPLGANFAYALNGTTNVPAQSGTTFGNLPAGTYTVTALNVSNNCSGISGTITLSASANTVTVDATATKPTCSGENDGMITITNPLGAGFMYSLSGPVSRIAQPAPFFGNLPAGVYTISVSNGAACAGSGNVTIVNPPVVTVTAQGNVAPCGSNNAGVVTAVGAGGTGNLMYALSGTVNRPFQVSNEFTGLPVGNYTVTARDANLCAAQSAATVSQPSAVTVTATTSPSTCGQANGTITAMPANFFGTPIYFVSGPVNIGPQLSPTFNTLAPGTYTVSVLDGNNCAAFTQITVGNNETFFSVSVQQQGIANCFGDRVDLIVNVLGGTSPYMYSLNSGPMQPSNLFAGVTAGSFNIRVKDAMGCTSDFTGTIGQPNTVTFTTQIVQPNCLLGTPSSLTINATGGSGSGYSYSIDGGVTYGISNAFDGLAPGNYNVVVRDGANCGSAPQVVVIANDNGVRVMVMNTVIPNCNGESSGSITVMLTNGPTPYLVSINGGAAVSVNSNMYTFTGLPADSYTIMASDNQGCMASATQSLSQPTAIVVSTTMVSPGTCNSNDNTGSITASATGGEGMYWFKLDGPMSMPLSQNSVFNNLIAGSYVVSVYDRNNAANHCIGTKVVNLSGPGAPTITSVVKSDPYCLVGDNANSGSIVIYAVGTSQPLYFSIDNGANYFASFNGTATYTDLPAGTYRVRVAQTPGGCVAFWQDVVLNAAPPMFVTSVTRQNPTCGPGGHGGSLTINGSGGQGMLAYSINDGALQASNVFTNLFPNQDGYEVEIRDENGCTINGGTYFFFNPSGLTMPTPTVTPPTCGMTNGSISVSPIGGTLPRTFWLNGVVMATTNVTTYVFNNVPEGIHTVAVTDASGCKAETQVYVSTLSIIAAETNPACASDNGGITLNISGGIGPFVYRITGGWNYNTTFATPGLPEVITGTFASAAVNSRTFIFPNNLAGGISTANGYTAGAYNVEVQDLGANGTCIVKTVVELQTQGTTPSILNVLATNRDCNIATSTVMTGSITVVAPGADFVGLSGPTSTLVATGGVPVTLFNALTAAGVPAGTYSTYALSNTGCVQFGSMVTVTEPAPIFITNVVVTQPVCGTANTGTVNITAMGGTSLDYVVTSTHPATGAAAVTRTQANNGVFTGYWPGTTINANAILVRQTGSAAGACEFVWPLAANVNNPSTLTVTNVTRANNTSCSATPNGTVTATVVGGTAPYTYVLSGVAGGPMTGSTSNLSFTFIEIGAMAANTLLVTVTDANGCTNARMLTLSITNTPMGVTIPGAQLINPTACANGQFRVNITNGGVGPYMYSINNGGAWISDPLTNHTFTGLFSGTYNVRVRNAAGCEATTTATLAALATFPTINSYAFTAPTCAGNDGSLTLGVTFGTNTQNAITLTEFLNGVATGTPYVSVPAVVNGVVLQTVTFSGLQAAHTYTLNIQESGGAGGCNSTIAALGLNFPGLSGTAAVTQPTCNPGTMGSVVVTATGGTPPIMYGINTVNNEATATYQATNTFANLADGMYFLFVRNTCTPTPAGVAVTGNPITIDNPGRVWDIQSITSTGNLCNSVVGDYTVTLTVAPVFPATIWRNGVQEGTITSGTTFSMANVPAGTYTIRVMDNNGCIDEMSVSIIVSPPLSVTETSQAPTTCGTANGSMTFTVSGGNTAAGDRECRLTSNGVTDPTWVAVPAGSPSGAVDATIYPRLGALGSGIHVLTVRNIVNTSCPFTKVILMNDPNNPVVTSVSTTDANNAGCNNGTLNINSIFGGGTNIRYEISGDNGFSWSGPQTSRFFPNLGPANYYVRIRTGATPPYCFSYFGPWTVNSMCPKLEGAIADAAVSSIAVYPNPNRGSFVVTLRNASEGVAQIQVMDMTGRVLKTQAVQTLEGNTDVDMDITEFTTGLYLVRVTQNGETNTIKVVKQ